MEIKLTIFLILLLFLTSCTIPEMCIQGDKIGYNETNEGHGFLKIWNCEEESIVSNISVPNNISIENHSFEAITHEIQVVELG